jgi:hypothetical protein
VEGFFVAGTLTSFLRLFTHRFESQYHSEYLREKEKKMSLERERYKAAVDSARKISERSIVIG